MASQREIKRRIRSTQNMAQITKALQMVAASRMRRAQMRVQASRPYSEAMTEIVADIMSRPGANEHPLLLQRDIRRADIVLVTPNRGLAGALITNVNREAARLVDRIGVPARFIGVGKKGRDFVVRSRHELLADYTDFADNVSIVDLRPVAEQVIDDYRNGDADVVYLVYPRFVSTLRQEPTSLQLLPVLAPEEATITANWNYEPDNPALVLEELIPRYVEFAIYQAQLETLASYHSAQMIAMSNATDNANDLVKDLTLVMNKARQAEITKEISEISGAAEAIRTGA
jgi:F-type H+-transporting ATPase subunit gamma